MRSNSLCAKTSVASAAFKSARATPSAASAALTAAIAELTGARVGELSEGANSAGGYLAGAVPHRKAGGSAQGEAGLDAAGIVTEAMDIVLLCGLEPEDITCVDRADSRLAAQGFVIACTPYTSESLEKAANLLLPIGSFAETSGTFINCEGRWQSFGGIANPVGEARPAWKVLRVLGNLLDADGFDYVDSEEIRDELKEAIGDASPDNSYKGTAAIPKPNGADEPAREIDVPIYQVDSVVRRAAALQLTPDALRSSGDDA